MQGQWIGRLAGEVGGTLRIELERRGGGIFGNAYLFYDAEHLLPGFKFFIKMPDTAPYEADVTTVYCYPSGGIMSAEDRSKAEHDIAERFGPPPVPATAKVRFKIVEENALKIDWEGEDQTGSETLAKSSAEGSSALLGEPDLQRWAEFRQWAVAQEPRRYIFRGQSNPYKLATTFHRTWRNDLNAWIIDDVRWLYGAIAERVSYPLQLGNLEHNAVIWSIIQHHGYPTPLLDWTFSPFVAAYFAFSAVDLSGADNPRIFMFDKTAWDERHGRQAFIVDAARPQLVTLENMTIGNPRSGPQQALSTVSNVTDIEAFVREQEEADGRTYLKVCDLPASEAPQIMRELELMGITYGSLFPGLDGVFRDLRNRLFAQPD